MQVCQCSRAAISPVAHTLQLHEHLFLHVFSKRNSFVPLELTNLLPLLAYIIYSRYHLCMDISPFD